MGNLWSISSAIDYLGYDFTITDNPHLIKESTHIILPGVGSFRKAVENLKKKKLFDLIKNIVETKRSKILGICLGFQLLGNSSDEDGFTEGFKFIDFDVRKFTGEELGNCKIPHIGFNTVQTPKKSLLFKGLSNKSDFYFVHSYKLNLPRNSEKVATCEHGVTFSASYEDSNIFGVQFHPEKSQSNGLKILSNFLDL